MGEGANRLGERVGDGGGWLGMVCGDAGNSRNRFQGIWGLKCAWGKREGAALGGARGGGGTLRRGPKGWVWAGPAHKGMLGSDDLEWGALGVCGRCPVGEEVCPRSWIDNRVGASWPGGESEHLAPKEEASGNVFKLQKPRPRPQRV